MSLAERSIIAVVSFAAGVLAMDVAQDWRDQAKAEQTAELVRKCPGYLVVAKDGGTTECRNLMLRFDYWWPCPERAKQRRKDALRATKESQSKKE